MKERTKTYLDDLKYHLLAVMELIGSTDEKLVYLTEAFLLTEEIRWELSGDSQEETQRTECVPTESKKSDSGDIWPKETERDDEKSGE